MKEETRASDTIIGLAAVGPVVVGLVCFVAARRALLGADFSDAGLLFIASGLSLGLLSIAVLGG